MLNLSDINVIRPLLERHGFNFSKALGQNFLINPSVCPKMAELSGVDSESGALEIGPGIGVLTAELAKRAKKVLCVELDRRLIPVLNETLAEFDNVEILNADILKLDLHEVMEKYFSGMRTVVCANLPYYITSPAIMALLESRIPVDAVTVMVQKEAAARLCADVGSRAAGAVTAAVSYYAEAKKLFDVSAGSFLPAPKVDSSVIRFDIRQTPAVELEDEKFFFRVIKAAFAQRRKTASNSLSAGLGMDKATVNAALEAAGLSPGVRPESLSMDELAALSGELWARR